MRADFQDITGRKFGNLTVAWPAGKYRRATVWLCFCTCGRTALSKTADLNDGNITRCRICFRIKHGAFGTKEYAIFSAAKARCTNSKHHAWNDYGGRGIKFLFNTFEEFMKELGPRPSAKYSLDRIENDGNYEIGNIRWATKKQQANNRRARCQ